MKLARELASNDEELPNALGIQRNLVPGMRLSKEIGLERVYVIGHFISPV